MYCLGIDVPQDYAEAMKWCKLAAMQGNSIGQNYVGLMHQKGFGTPINYSEAIKWYTKAVEQGNSSALNNLGKMYADGIGVPANDIIAYSYLSAAAALNNQDARNNLLILKKRMTSDQVAEGQKAAKILWNKLKK